MRLIKLMILAGLLGFGWHYWQKKQVPEEDYYSDTETRSSSGFVSAPSLSGVNPKNVIVISPPHCTSHEAQMARELVQELQQKGIPVTLTGSLSFTSNHSEDMALIEGFMNNGPPLVFVRGRAKSKPSLSEVIAEYRAR